MQTGNKRHEHSDYQRIDADVLNRISSLTDRRNWDGVLHRSWVRPDGAALAEDDLGVFGGDFLVAHSSGAREAGMTFSIAAGTAFKYLDTNQSDADEPSLIMLHSAVALSANLSASHATLDRIDAIYIKRNSATGDSATRDIINPSTLAITGSSIPTTRAYGVTVAVATGTPHASPVEPSPPSGYDAEDKLATITVQAGSGSFDPADLTDNRVVLTPRVQEASTTRKGQVQYATTAEIVASTPPADRVISPALLLAGWTLGSTGKIEIAGLKIIWQTSTLATGGDEVVTFHEAFTSAVYGVLATGINGSGIIERKTLTTSQVTLNGGAATDVFVVAIGKDTN